MKVKGRIIIIDTECDELINSKKLVECCDQATNDMVENTILLLKEIMQDRTSVYEIQQNVQNSF